MLKCDCLYTDDKKEFRGLVAISQMLHKDMRGYFFESFNQHDFDAAGICSSFVQDNISFSNPYVARGLHFQKKHPQAKLIRCVAGSLVDVMLDLREGPTFGKYCSVSLDCVSCVAVYVPKGVAHGFYTLSGATVFYKCDDFYYPDDEGGILFDFQPVGDLLGVSDSCSFTMSNKDKLLPLFNPQRKYFDKKGEWIG